MNNRALRHSNRKEILRRASLKYLDTSTRSATSPGPKNCSYSASSAVVLVCSAQQAGGNQRAR
eukprot:3214462-Pyramimonas_sp.AAC.1